MFEKISEQESTERPKRKCLFIDDQKTIIDGIKRFLRKSENFVAIECHSVEDAIDAIIKFSPDIIFLDHNISEIGDDGFIIAEKALEINPQIKIYSTTRNFDTEEIYSQKGIEHINKSDLQKIEEIVKS